MQADEVPSHFHRPRIVPESATPAPSRRERKRDYGVNGYTFAATPVTPLLPAVPVPAPPNAPTTSRSVVCLSNVGAGPRRKQPQRKFPPARRRPAPPLPPLPPLPPWQTSRRRATAAPPSRRLSRLANRPAAPAARIFATEDAIKHVHPRMVARQRDARSSGFSARTSASTATSRAAAAAAPLGWPPPPPSATLPRRPSVSISAGACRSTPPQRIRPPRRWVSRPCHLVLAFPCRHRRRRRARGRSATRAPIEIRRAFFAPVPLGPHLVHRSS